MFIKSNELQYEVQINQQQSVNITEADKKKS